MLPSPPWLFPNMGEAGWKAREASGGVVCITCARNAGAVRCVNTSGCPSGFGLAGRERLFAPSDVGFLTFPISFQILFSSYSLISVSFLSPAKSGFVSSPSALSRLTRRFLPQAARLAASSSHLVVVSSIVSSLSFALSPQFEEPPSPIRAVIITRIPQPSPS